MIGSTSRSMGAAYVPHVVAMKRGGWRAPSRSQRRMNGVSAQSCGSECVSGMRRVFDSFQDSEGDCVPVTALRTEEFEPWLESASPATKAWLADVKFNAKTAGSVAIVPKFDGDGQGGIGCVLLSVGSGDAMSTPWSYAELPKKLPAGKSYGVSGSHDPDALALGWALGSYTFRAYKSEKPGDAGQKPPKLQISPSPLVASAASATFLARDLINYSAEDMRPEELEAATRSLGERHGATVSSIVGADLLEQNFPMIHAVGRAATQKGAEPRLVDLRWKDDESLPLVAICGKGVTFDTGGLDIKPAAAMRNMKKDMGGAATVLGLASMIMESDLPVRLRVLIAAVENSVGGDAFRPGDVIKPRRGPTTEIDNTDAEGRLILSDALSYACEEKPDLLIDFATLTGAQRVALGTEIPSSMTSREDDGHRLRVLSGHEHDLIWDLPLHKPYRKLLDSNVADIKNAASVSYAGAITAALFLNEFVTAGTRWIHVDHMGYNVSSKPGRPEGGEAQGMRAMFRFVSEELLK